jgi:hypothetical protein
VFPGATSDGSGYQTSAAGGGRVETTEVGTSLARRQPPGAPPASVALAALGVFTVGLLAAVARSRRNANLGRSERLLRAGRPRTGVQRYALSLDLEVIGPLRTTTARRLATTIARASR